MDAKAITKAGFTQSEASADYFTDLANGLGLSANGPYKIIGAFQRGEYTLVIEQNTAPEDFGGLKAVITYPETAILEGPNGRVAFDPNDTELLTALLQ